MNNRRWLAFSRSVSSSMRCWLICMLWLPVLAFAETPASAPRVISLGGDITETIYELDAGALLVGVDSTSQWPAAARQLPDVGYLRQLSAEGVLALRPQLIVANHDAGPPAVITQLQSAGARMEMLPVSHTAADVVSKVRAIGRLLGRTAQAEVLAAKIEKQYAVLAVSVKAMAKHPRVLFLMSTGVGSPMAAGRNTAAEYAIALAGGKNVVDGYTGYKPISAEALVGLAPDAIVLMRERNEEVGGVEGVLKLPGVLQTPAGKAKQVFFVDGQSLLGFGPRSVEQAQALQRTLAGLAP